MVKAKVQRLAYDVERLHACKLEATRQVCAWLVSYVAAVLNRARVGRDGRTLRELRKGRPSKRALAPFGERVMYLPAREHRSQVT